MIHGGGHAAPGVIVVVNSADMARQSRQPQSSQPQSSQPQSSQPWRRSRGDRNHAGKGGPVNILGINSVYHEFSRRAARRRRARRRRRGGAVQSHQTRQVGRTVDNPHQLPERAIRFCLNHAGLTAGDIDHVAYSFDPQLRRTQYRAEWWDPRFEETFRLRLGQVRGVAEELLGRPLRQRFHFVPHHLAHAASAYFPSGFDRAAILTIDGIGEVAGSTLAKAVGTRIQPVETFDYPHSLGFVWEVISSHLGFSHYDASKVMGLAAYGNPEVFRREFQSILRVGKEDYAVSPEFLGFQSGPVRQIGCLVRSAARSRIPKFCRAMPISRRRCRRRRMRRSWRSCGASNARCRSTDLCLAGGVALNCVTNELVRQSGEFSDVFIPSAPHDAGTAIGAAFVVHCAKQKTSSRARQLHAVSRSRVQPARNSGGGQVGRSHAAAQQIPGARRRGDDRRWQDRRLVSGSHGVRAARARQPIAARRPAPTGHAQHPQSNGQAPRGLPAVCAERHGRTRRRMVRDWRPLDESRIHAVCMCGQARAARSHPCRRCTRTAAPGCSSCAANQIRAFTS